MNPIALQFAGGNGFFAGCALIALGCAAAAFDGPRLAVLWRIAMIIGAIFVAISSIPLPIWLYAPWALAVVGALIAATGKPARPRWARAAEVVGLALTIFAAAWEVPNVVMPRIPGGHQARIVVIGDSLTAGMNDGTKTWPDLLAEEHKLDILSLAQPGLQLAGAAEIARGIPPAPQGRPTVAILELGGNDVFGGVSDDEFERCLGQLLAMASARADTVVLLELPLPPFRNRLAAIQRRLARDHKAILVPKRAYTEVIGAPDATVDGLHLSQSGQRRMARIMLDILDATGDSPGKEKAAGEAERS
ncbi:MAG: hypothetical protein ISS78_09175 [Phycisphaerae bacterium]|nr:hypothetical protein [Phycisphaerae bacterium]